MKSIFSNIVNELLYSSVAGLRESAFLSCALERSCSALGEEAEDAGDNE